MIITEICSKTEAKGTPTTIFFLVTLEKYRKRQWKTLG